MLLIDGVKYKLWTPPTEDEFERVVKEHAQDIFGEKSIYLDRKQKLKSLSGIGSIPDGFVILFGDSPQWHIVEVELSSHPLHDHIVSQVGRFISGISNPNIQRGIVNAIDEEISRDDFLKLRLRKAIEPTEIYRFLVDLISKQPILTIIIEKDTQELREALTTLRYPQIKVVEFRTFTREGLGLAVHGHLFEPLYEAKRKVSDLLSKQQRIEITLWPPSRINYHRIDIPEDSRHLFPGYGEPFTIETDIGKFETILRKQKHAKDHFHLVKWFEAHPELQAGDKLIIEVIEPMKKYRLEIVKQEKESGWRPIRLSP